LPGSAAVPYAQGVSGTVPGVVRFTKGVPWAVLWKNSGKMMVNTMGCLYIYIDIYI
jgi:hypothetical protein